MFSESTPTARGLLITAAAVIGLPAVAAAAGTQFELDNPGDPNFNQLLGINDAGVIVGYFGDGSVVPNNGYVLVPKNHYAVENFTHLPAGDKASQTQAIGINNLLFPEVVGFYTESATNFTHGFLDADGVQYSVDDPAGLPPEVNAPAQNLLGINDSGTAVGFWTDNNGHEHGFVVGIDARTHQPSKFIEVAPKSFPGAIATQVSDLNDRDEICGFWTDSSNNNHGFFGRIGERLATFNVDIGGAVATSTAPFGCNNRGEIVGTFTDKQGGVHGFTYADGRFRQFDAAGSSQTAAFGVSGTLINGVNDAGDIVGFFSDGTKVNGFARYDGGN
jgi:probable HAF family extracellular repeat protein